MACGSVSCLAWSIPSSENLIESRRLHLVNQRHSFQKVQWSCGVLGGRLSGTSGFNVSDDCANALPNHGNAVWSTRSGIRCVPLTTRTVYYVIISRFNYDTKRHTSDNRECTEMMLKSNWPWWTVANWFVVTNRSSELCLLLVLSSFHAFHFIQTKLRRFDFPRLLFKTNNWFE